VQAQNGLALLGSTKTPNLPTLETLGLDIGFGPVTLLLRLSSSSRDSSEAMHTLLYATAR